MLAESVKEYSLNKKEDIPYIEGRQRSIKYQEARELEANPLIHTIHLVGTLPEYMVAIEEKYE